MNNMLKWLAVGGLLASATGIASAQDTILNTLGRIPGHGDSAFVGIDPGNQMSAAQTFQTAGYAVVPFLTTAAAAGEQITSVQLAGVFLPPSNTSASSNLGSLYGAFIQAPTGNSLNANANKIVGSIFKFDTTIAQGFGNASQGDGNFHNNFTATPTASSVVLAANTQYWFVVLPKGDLTPTASTDPLTDIFQVEARTSAVIRTVNLSTMFASEQQGLAEGTQGVPGNSQSGGAQPGDTLQGFVNSGANPLYFGVNIQAAQAAPVPEASTLVTISLGMVVMGGGMLRRRARKTA